MAQTIQLKRGGVGALSTTVTANIGEVLIVTGSANNLEGPFLVVGIGDTSASLVNPVQLGGTPPSLNDNNKQLNGAIFYDTGSNRLYRLDNSGNTEITLGSLQNEARFALTGSTNFFKDSQIITGSTLLASPDTAPTETRAASAANNNYALVVSQSAYFSNHNVGHPNSLAWGSDLDGSIFNSYNANTDVAEILRSIVGIMSASHPAFVANPAANSTTFTGTDVLGNEVPSATIDSSIGTDARIPQSYTEANAAYLELKGFNDGAGDKLFENVSSTIYEGGNFSNFGLQLRSDPGNGTTFFDAGDKDTAFTVFAQVSQAFSDTQTDTTPDENSTFTTESSFTFTQTGAGTSNGIIVQTIATDVPTVIPPVFQEARFTGTNLQTDLKTKTGINFDNISSSGYYKYYGIRAGIATGSTSLSDVIGGSLNASTNTNNAQTTFFYTPLQGSDISDNTVTTTEGTVTQATATSRSLSGAPYLNGATYTVVNYTASGLFDPLFYGSNANLADLEIGSTNLTITPTSVNDVRAKANGGTIDSGYINIFNGNTERSAGNVPGRTDTIRFNTTYTFGRSTGNDLYESSVTETGTSEDTSFTLDLNTRTWKNDTSNTETQTVNYHTAGTFGQHVDSGSLRYFISNDGEETAPGTQVSDANDEYFGGEGFRLPIEATGDLTGSNDWNSGSYLSLGDGGDLQVKPGYLVNPESSYGYWYPSSGYNATHYKWYVREFDTGFSGANASTLTIDLDPNNDNDLVGFDTTTTGKIAIGVIFEDQVKTNSGTGDGSNSFAGDKTRIFDVYDGYALSNDENETVTANSNQKNPFSDSIDLRAQWGGGSESSGTITMTLANNVGQKITSTNSSVYLAIRYTGTPSNSLERISVSAS